MGGLESGSTCQLLLPGVSLGKAHGDSQAPLNDDDLAELFVHFRF